MASLRKALRPRRLLPYALAALLIGYATPTPSTLLAGLIPILVGEGLRIWACGHLFKNDALTITGPYGYLRDPLYLGTLLIGTGLAIMAATPLAYALLGVFTVGYFGYYMPYKNRIEGARLESRYGDAYRRYAVAVPSLLPRLHAYVPLASEASPAPPWRLRFADNNEIGTAVAVLLGVALLTARWALV
jgi:hypothetical protein